MEKKEGSVSMAGTKAPKIGQILSPLNSGGYYIVAIVLIAGIALSGVMFRPEQSIAILSFSGSILVALLTILKGQSEVHNAVNSKMDILLKLVEDVARAEGMLAGREVQRRENSIKRANIKDENTES